MEKNSSHYKHYTRRSTLSIDAGLELIAAPSVFATVDGKKVNTKSLRYFTFLQKGVDCAVNGCYKGSYFALERHSKGERQSWHLNLYGVNARGDVMLMTRDHIIAQCLGGPDTVENSQTMCDKHNRNKGFGEYLQAVKGQKGLVHHVQKTISLSSPVELEMLTRLAYQRGALKTVFLKTREHPQHDVLHQYQVQFAVGENANSPEKVSQLLDLLKKDVERHFNATVVELRPSHPEKRS